MGALLVPGLLDWSRYAIRYP